MREAVEEGHGRDRRTRRSAWTRSTPPTPSPTPTSTSSPPSRLELEAIVNAAHADSADLQLGGRRGRAAPAALGAEDRAALRRREAPRGAVPAAAVQAGHPAARRAHQPPRRRERRVAGAVPAALSRHRGRGDARPLLPRQRRAVDPRARPRLRHSLGGQLLLVAGAEGEAPGDRGEAGAGAHQGDAEGAGVGAPEPQGPAGEVEGAPGALRGAVLATSTRSATRPRRSSSRWPTAWATR